MQTIQLTAVSAPRRSLTARAIKDMLIGYGMPPAEALDRAVRIVTHVLETGTPCDVIVVDDQDVLDKAVTAFRSAVPEDYATITTVGRDAAPEPAEPEDAEPDTPADEYVTAAMLTPLPDDYTPTREGALVMALLLGMCDGKAALAFIYARRLAVVSGQPDLFIDVARAIIASYGFTADVQDG